MIDIDAALVGICLTRPEEIDKVISEGLTAEHFTSDKAKNVWLEIVRLHTQKMPVTLEVVGLSTGDPLYCIDATTASPVSIEATVYAKEIINAYWRRTSASALLAAAKEIGEATVFSDTSKLVEVATAALSSVARGPETNRKERTQSIREIAEELAGTLDERVNAFNAGKPIGIPTGFKNLDKAIAGWTPGRVYILGARTSVGKTTLAVNFAVEAAAAGKNILCFTVEMTRKEIAEKMLSRVSKVNGNKIFNGNFTSDDLDQVTYGLNQLCNLPVSINDRAGRNIAKLEAETRMMKSKGLCDLMIVDYVQLMKSGDSFDNRQSEIAEISFRLKTLAMNLQIPIIALCQLNRETEKTGDEPQLSHLRDSGSLEQDADAVLLIHRKRREINGGDPTREWDYFLKVAKNRQGPTGAIPLKTNLPINLFADYEGVSF